MSKVFKDPNQKNKAGEFLASIRIDPEKPAFYFDRDLNIISCNDAFNRLFSPIKTGGIFTKLPEHRLNHNLLQALQKAFADGLSTFQGHILTDHSTLPVHIDAVLIRQQEISVPSPERVMCIVTNANADGGTKPEAASGSKQQYMPAFFNAAITLYALDGKAIYISPSVESLIGYTSEELLGMNPLDFIHPDDLPGIDALRRNLTPENNNLHTQYRLLHRNGSLVYVESSNYYITGSAGKEAHIVSVTWDRSAQVETQHALERSEQKYYRLVMNLPTGISLISTSGQLLEVNEAMKQIMGMPPGAPMPDLNFFNFEEMKKFNIHSQIKKCIETKEIVSGELSLRVNNFEQSKFLSYSFVPVFDSNQQLDVIIGYVTDHSQQLKAEAEKRERTDFLNLVINAIKSPFFVKDEEHKWVMLNDAAVQMMGRPREMLIGRSDYDLYPKEQADIFWKYDELVFKKGSSENEEVITWSDGTAHTIVTNKQLYIEKPTGKKFIVGTIHDVSGYKKIEEELRASEHKYHELFDNANDYIITIDLDGKITNANRTLLNYLQTDLDQITQHSVFDYIHRDHLESAKASKNKILAGIYNDPFEVVAIGANGQEVTFEVKASPVMQNGQLTGIQCVFSDVTLRKQATEKLEKYTQDLIDLNKTKDKFFSIIAHDLRNPYSSMIGFSEMLLEDLDDMSKEEIRDSLKIIHTSAKHSFNLLDNLLVWSRLQTGHMPFNQAPIALINAVEEVNNVLFSLAYRKKIEINNLVRPDIILYADKNMLHSILNNLVMNAIKYTPTGGKINITAEHKNDSPETDPLFVSISVADTGIGMESELLENIFTANKVISKPGTDREQGTGLGLLLTREMIEKHGGNISAGSIPGEGSVFTFQLPAYKPDHIKQEQHKTPGDEIHVDTSN